MVPTPIYVGYFQGAQGSPRCRGAEFDADGMSSFVQDLEYLGALTGTQLGLSSAIGFDEPSLGIIKQGIEKLYQTIPQKVISSRPSDFDQEGFDEVQRDIERLYLLISIDGPPGDAAIRPGNDIRDSVFWGEIGGNCSVNNQYGPYGIISSSTVARVSGIRSNAAGGRNKFSSLPGTRFWQYEVELVSHFGIVDQWAIIGVTGSPYGLTFTVSPLTQGFPGWDSTPGRIGIGYYGHGSAVEVNGVAVPAEFDSYGDGAVLGVGVNFDAAPGIAIVRIHVNGQRRVEYTLALPDDGYMLYPAMGAASTSNNFITSTANFTGPFKFPIPFVATEFSAFGGHGAGGTQNQVWYPPSAVPTGPFPLQPGQKQYYYPWNLRLPQAPDLGPPIGTRPPPPSTPPGNWG